ncbi:glycosyltransferase family 4 protein [uncultured Pseudodesulfovibrio sp.]|jgi:glycosyltransferase involved in cell wall biosynthesis|uniref:glycosyltransferase family 4 protein n=1 Tax=uncultured Pseudodesulfovibrio sp. TaxID=2035858 RepID=UPI0029C85473|nr:glycosyltransferase family 4 protein [uncultured Pseudodesulfovibrio sp.]
MINILFVAHSNAAIGGAPKSLTHLVKNIPTDQCDCTIACHTQEVADRLGTSGAKTVVWGRQPTFYGKIAIGWSPINSFSLVWRLVKECACLPLTILKQIRRMKELSPDIVHLNSSVLFHSAIAARWLGIPVIWHIRESGERSLRRTLCGKLINALASSIICISEAERTTLGLTDSPKAHVVYNPVDFTALDPTRFDKTTERRKLGVENNDFLLLTLGGANPRKGAAEILEAAALLPENVKVVFAGPPLPDQDNQAQGSFMTQLRALQNALSPQRVISVGNVTDVAPLLAACDVLVFAGKTPHFPRPVYEAWAMKKPVIAFDTPGMDENVEHGVDGLMATPHTGKGLASAISRLIDDPDLASPMGQAGHAKSQRRMNPITGANTVFRIYTDIIKQQKETRTTAS